jgi:outer membrane protein assembly factor BamB
VTHRHHSSLFFAGAAAIASMMLLEGFGSIGLCPPGLRPCATLSAQAIPVGDWPQWQGPTRNNASTETGLLKQWPAAGPPQLWSVSAVGGGYGSLAITGDRIFLQGSDGKRSMLHVLNRANGKNLWSKAIGAAGSNDRGSGPRGTPTVDGDRVYVLTENGDLACLKTLDGAAVWQRNILKDFNGRNLNWLISESPLVDGNNVIVSPGGSGAGMVALDKMTGKTVWVAKELNDEAGYGSAIVADVQGVRSVMVFTSDAAVGVRAADGKLMWRYRAVANRTANIATPIFKDNKVLFTSGYGTGAALLGLTAQGGEVKAQEIYFTRDLQNHHGGVVLVNGYVYGFNNSIMSCLDFANGQTMWRNRSVGKGSLTYADGNLYVLSEDNVVGLVEAVPGAYREKGRFKIPDKGLPSWAHPVVSGARLYIRNQDTLMAFNIKEQ